jgi:hypothetical protein
MMLKEVLNNGGGGRKQNTIIYTLYEIPLKKTGKTRCLGLTPVILATHEAEMEANPGK